MLPVHWCSFWHHLQHPLDSLQVHCCLAGDKFALNNGQEESEHLLTHMGQLLGDNDAGQVHSRASLLCANCSKTITSIAMLHTSVSLSHQLFKMMSPV